MTHATSSPTLDRFLQLAPCAVMARTAIENLFDPDRIDHLFERAADTQYQRELLFSDLLHLMLTVVLRIKPSIYAAYQDSDITVSHQATYDKLKGIDISTCEALVLDSATQVEAVIDALSARIPEPIPGLRLRILDGNLLTGTERRLKPLRSVWMRGLPGRVLAVYEPGVDLVTHAFVEPDGHACERTRMDDVLDLVQKNDLWVADRAFCTHAILREVADRHAYFLVRHHGAMHGKPQGKRRWVGRTETGKVYEERWILEGKNAGWAIRRITLILDKPNRKGDREIHILSNVLRKNATGVKLMEVYRQRWSIEDRFYEMATTLNAEPKSLCHPMAALFTFSLGLMASNAVAMMRAALRAVHGAEPVRNMSRQRLANQIRETYTGMMIALPPEFWAAYRDLSVAELAECLRGMASFVPVAEMKKAKRGPKKPPTEKKAYKNGSTASTHRLLHANEIPP